MYQIQLTDQVYDEVKRRADRAGFTNIDDYVAQVLTHRDVSEDAEELDYLFTPERIAQLDRISAEVKAGGKTYTMKEVEENLAQYRSDWIRENGK